MKRLAPYQEKSDDKLFHPHLTLGRVRALSRADREALVSLGERQIDRPPPPWRLEELTLFRSHLAPEAPRYEVVSKVKMLKESL